MLGLWKDVESKFCACIYALCFKFDPTAEFNPIEQRMKKVRVAVAVDTGATTNASPNGVFGTNLKPHQNTESLFGADNNDMLNLGT